MFNPFEKMIRRVSAPYLRTYKQHPPRRQVDIFFVDGSKTTMSWARWLMTQHLRRTLKKDEHVDHVNENPTDDRIENFQLLTPRENSRKSLLGKPSSQKGTETGWTHGTFYAWMKKKCVCEICAKAKRAWQDARNTQRRTTGIVRGPYSTPTHGTNSMYRTGCRCDACRRAHTEAVNEYRSRTGRR